MSLVPDTTPELIKTGLAYALYERALETDLRTAFAALVQERHDNFHNEVVPIDRCKNEKCVAALRLLEDARKPEVELNDLSLEIVKDRTLAFKPIKNGERVERIVISLVEKQLVERPPLIVTARG